MRGRNYWRTTSTVTIETPLRPSSFLNRHANKWDAFSLYLVQNVNYLRELESLLVHIAEPKGNRVRGRFARSSNLMRELEHAMAARDRAQREQILIGTKKRGSKRKYLRTVAKRGKPGLQGYITSPAKIKATYKGREYFASVRSDGMIEYEGGVYNSPSHVASMIAKRAVNGWTFWRYQDSSGEWKLIDTLRKK